MEDEKSSNSFLYKKINPNDHYQIDTLSKLFQKSFLEVQNAVTKTDGTFKEIEKFIKKDGEDV